MKKVKVAIIGAGSAGLSARREVSQVTQDYVVINSGPLGTTCARVGCMPSKVLIQAANDYHRRHKFAEQGIIGAEKLNIDIVQTFKHVRKLRDRFVRAVINDMESWKEKLISKNARFLDPHTLDIGGEKIQAEKIIIATGSKPRVPANFEGCENFFITTDQIFEQEQLPKRLLVLGLGVIGIELGQALCRLGVDVYGVNRSKRIAGTTDEKLGAYVLEKFNQEMNLFFGGVKQTQIQGEELLIKVDGAEFIVDKVLLATGRVPQLENIGLENLKLNLNSHHLPDLIPETFQLREHPHIFLTGDATGENQILHEASDEGKIAGFNSVNTPKNFKTRTPLLITFCDPNIASVGASYKELEEKKLDYVVGEVSFEGQGRSIVKLKEKGLLRVYGEKSTGLILGAEMFGPDCEHIAHLLSWAIAMKCTVVQTLSFPFYHPVIEEGLRTALRDLRSKCDVNYGPLEISPLSENN